LSNRIFKNNQVNVGIPFQIKSLMTYQPPVRISNLNIKKDLDQMDQLDEDNYKARGEEIVIRAKTEADFIIKEALLEAKEIVAKAATDVEDLKIETLATAREEGYNTGVDQAKQEYKQLMDEAKDINEQAGVEYNKILYLVEADAVDTVLDIARKVISQELKCKENVLLLVRDAFEKCSKDGKAVLKLCERDYELINENKEELISMLERSEDIEIKKDLSLKEGGCIINTPYGSIDASAYTKLDKIENDFKSILDEKMI